MSHPGFKFKPEVYRKIRWSNGSCGTAGCTDETCTCSLCGRPIGVFEDDPRWNDHPDDCVECDLCIDQVPTILFRGEGLETQQAQFHLDCFRELLA